MNTQRKVGNFVREVLRPQDAAEFLGISQRQVYNLAETDPLFPRKIVFSSRCVGWRRQSLEQYIKDKEASAI